MFEEKKVTQSVFRVRRKLSRIVELLEEGSLSFHYGGRPIRAKKIDIVRIVSQTKFENTLDHGIRNIILEGITSAESYASGSGYLALKMLLSGKRFAFEDCFIRGDKKDIYRATSNLLGVGMVQKILEKTIEDASIDSEVVIRSSDFANSISLRTMPSVLLPGEFAGNFTSKTKQIHNAEIVVIDGVLEGVGSIDLFLQQLSTHKKSVVILARGYSPDVVSTLFKNYSLGNFYVYPFEVPMGEKVLETLSKVDTFFNVENFHMIRSINCDDLSFESTVFVKPGVIEVSGLESVSRKVFLTMPRSHENILGVVSDRVLLGLKAAQEACRSGFCVESNSKKCFSILAARKSLEVYSSLSESLHRTGYAILQEK